MISAQTLKLLDEYLTSIHQTTPQLLIKKDCTETERIASDVLAFVDESGEFVAEMRKYLKLIFSQKKLDGFDVQHVEAEGVDVLITLLLCLKSVGTTSLDEAVLKKIQKNNERGY